MILHDPRSITHHPIIIFFSMILLFCGFSPISEIKNERGNDFYKKGELGKARTEYRGALKSNPRQTAAHYNLGNTYYKEDAYDVASGAYEHAALGEKDALLKSKEYYNLGNSLFRQNQKDKAIEAYKNALRSNPADQDAKYNLELLTRKDDQKKDDQEKDDQKKDDQNKEEQKQEDQKKEGQEQGEQPGDEKKEEPQGDQEKEGQGREDEKKEGQESKSASQIRAEQILAALENQEQQVLKLQGSQKNSKIQAGRVSDKDW